MRTRVTILLWTIFTTSTLVGCEKIKRKSDDLSDKVVAKFDPINPDTRFNKKRFAEFFGFTPAEDVTNLYCYSELGADASYYFSFKCNETTLKKIKEGLKLTNDSTSIGLTGFDLNYAWWDKDKIEAIKPLTRQDGSLYWYLWYDRKNGHVYFLTFDT
ncbi:MAG TPA: hypothetical protein VGD40_13090 [Chryseosolibacter sp.]